MAIDRTELLATLKPLVAAFLELLDADREVDTSGSALDQSCNAAITAAQAYAQRRLFFDTYIDRYEVITGGVIRVKELPLKKVIELRVGSTVLVENTDYTVEDGAIRFADAGLGGIHPFEMGLEAGATPLDRYNVRVEYQGGYEIDGEGDIAQILDAVTQQAAANFRRKETVGMANVASPAGLGSIATTKGGMLTEVKEMLDPFVYYGVASDS